MPRPPLPLWTCPRCGHRFVTPNLAHSCGRFRLSDHFKGKPAELRATFRALVRVVRTLGPVTVYAQKTRIVFMVRVRFASVVVRSRWLDLGVWLTRRVEHPLIARVEHLGPTTHYTHFHLASPDELDPALIGFLADSYRIGEQRHLQER